MNEMFIKELSAQLLGVEAEYRNSKITDEELERMMIQKHGVDFNQLSDLERLTLNDGEEKIHIFGKRLGKGVFQSVFKVKEMSCNA